MSVYKLVGKISVYKLVDKISVGKIFVYVCKSDICGLDMCKQMAVDDMIVKQIIGE